MYLKECTRDSSVKVKESELSVELFNGAKISLYGADNPDALRGIYLDGVVLDEFGDCRPSLWAEVILPTLTDREGWATFIGTPKGKNHFFQIREMARQNGDDWFYLSVRASESGILPEKELSMAKNLMEDAQFAQEYECSFDAAVRGTYYSAIIVEMEKSLKITKVPHEKGVEVNVAMDLGYTDSTAMWFWQERTDGPAVIDYDEDSGKGLPHYFTLLVAKPYKIGTIYLPHDAKSKTLQTGRSTIELFLKFIEENELDWELEIVPRLDLQDGIDAVRYILPKCSIDQENCFNGIEALRAYKRKYNEITKAFSDKPEHDWSSHGADAFRQFALVTKEKFTGSSLRSELTKQGIDSPGFYPVNLDTLFSDRERRRVNWRRSNRI